jgi:hypothetical protein
MWKGKTVKRGQYDGESHCPLIACCGDIYIPCWATGDEHDPSIPQ